MKKERLDIDERNVLVFATLASTCDELMPWHYAEHAAR